MGAQAVAVVPVAHIGAGARLRLDKPRLAQFPVNRRDGHLRDAGPLGQFPHRGQALAGRQLAQGNPELDQATQLDAKRDGQRAVERSSEVGKNALIRASVPYHYNGCLHKRQVHVCQL